MLDAIRHNGYNIDERDYKITRLAALLHDVGHYPFSHATEEAISLVENVPALSGGSSFNVNFVDHEDVGRYIIENDPEISSLLKEEGFSSKEIVARLEGADETSLNLLVSSDLDCDRLDYLRRTALHVGLPYGGVDANYLVDNLTMDMDGLPCLHSKAIGAADHFLVSRLYDFEQVPFHKAVVGYEEALKKTLAAMINSGAIDLSKRAISGMISDGSWRRFDDQMMMGEVRKFRDAIASDHTSAVLPFVDCILNRRSPKVMYEFHYLDFKTENSDAQFQQLGSDSRKAAISVYDEFGIDRDMTFEWSKSFPILKPSESGQRARILPYGDASLRSFSIDEIARTLCSRLDGIVLRHLRFYACLNAFPNQKHIRAEVRDKINELIDELEIIGLIETELDALVGRSKVAPDERS